MRDLIITAGAPGSGKSTWVENQNLSQYTISADNLRLLYSSPRIAEDGSFEISQHENKIAWENLYEILEKRMKNGDFTVLDSTNLGGAKSESRLKQLVSE